MAVRSFAKEDTIGALMRNAQEFVAELQRESMIKLSPTPALVAAEAGPSATLVPVKSQATATPTCRPTQAPTTTRVPTRVYVAPTIVVQRECNRYTVTHLDGSTSRLCYNQRDYSQLVTVGYKYSSAKSFYEFQLRAADRYQEEYERYGSSVYLDGKARAEADAAEEKQKMESAVAEMQEIEKRGY